MEQESEIARAIYDNELPKEKELLYKKKDEEMKILEKKYGLNKLDLYAKIQKEKTLPIEYHKAKEAILADWKSFQEKEKGIKEKMDLSREAHKRRQILELTDEEIDLLDVLNEAKKADSIQDLISQNLVDEECL
jgi:hypothetical protein